MRVFDSPRGIEPLPYENGLRTSRELHKGTSKAAPGIVGKKNENSRNGPRDLRIDNFPGSRPISRSGSHESGSLVFVTLRGASREWRKTVG